MRLAKPVTSCLLVISLAKRAKHVSVYLVRERPVAGMSEKASPIESWRIEALAFRSFDTIDKRVDDARHSILGLSHFEATDLPRMALVA